MACVLEGIDTDSQLDAGEVARRELSVEAAKVTAALRRYAAAAEEPYPCVS